MREELQTAAAHQPPEGADGTQLRADNAVAVQCTSKLFVADVTARARCGRFGESVLDL